MKFSLLLFISVFIFCSECKSSNNVDSLNKDSLFLCNKYLDKTYRKTKKFNRQVSRINRHNCRKSYLQERKIKKKLCRVDPALSDYLFSYKFFTSPVFYSLFSPSMVKNNKNEKFKNESVYFAYLDSLKINVNFIDFRINRSNSSHKRKIERVKLEIEKAAAAV